MSKNSTLIMGLTPDPYVKWLKELSDEIKSMFYIPIAETSGNVKRIVVKPFP